MLIKPSFKNIFKIVLVFTIAAVINIFNSLNFIILETNNMIAYTGAMMGFALTIYTFGISILGQIKDLIKKSVKIKDENKNDYLDKLLSAFHELKEDVGAIAITLIIVVVASTIQSLNNFNNYANDFLKQFTTIGYFNLYTTVKMFSFLLSSWMFIDLTKAMLNISQFYQELIKQDQ